MNKEELIIDLICHPDRYSDERMQEILSDPESLDIYTAMLDARMAIDRHDAGQVDVDKAWQRFAADNKELLGLHSAKTSSMSPNNRSAAGKWRKIAAIFIGGVALSGITFTAIHTITADRIKTVDAESAQDATAKAADTVADSTSTAIKEDAGQGNAKPAVHKTFENVPLGDMLQEIAQYYDMSVELRNNDARSLRYYYEWNSTDGVDAVIDELNHSQQVALTVEKNKIIVE